MPTKICAKHQRRFNTELCNEESDTSDKIVSDVEYFRGRAEVWGQTQKPQGDYTTYTKHFLASITRLLTLANQRESTQFTFSSSNGWKSEMLFKHEVRSDLIFSEFCMGFRDCLPTSVTLARTVLRTFSVNYLLLLFMHQRRRQNPTKQFSQESPKDHQLRAISSVCGLC